MFKVIYCHEVLFILFIHFKSADYFIHIVNVVFRFVAIKVVFFGGKTYLILDLELCFA